MGKLLSTLALLAGLVLVVIMGFTTWLNDPVRVESERAYRAQKNAIELQAERERAAWWSDMRQGLAPWLLAGGIGVTVALSAGLGIAALAFGLSAWDERQKRRRTYAPDERGLLPVTQNTLDQAAAVALTGFHQASIQAAQQPRLPDTLRTYAPRYIEGRQAAPALPNRPPVELPAPQQAAALPGPVALAHVLTWQPDLSRVLIGLDSGGRPLTVSARELCHVALVGATGGGKSNAMRLLLAQLLASGGRAVLLDPHYAPLDPDDPTTGDWRPIEARLYRPPAVLPSEIGAAFDWLTDELDERLARRRAGERSGPPLFVAIDELPSIVAHVDQAPDVLTRIVREGRKVGLLAITSSQDFLVKSIGTGSAARDSFRTAIYAGGDVHSARVLLDVPARQIPEGELGKGIVMLRSQATPEAARARLPLVTDSDLYRLLPAPQPDQQAAPSRSVVDGRGRSDGENEAQTPLERPEFTDRPRPTATDRPALRVVKPQTLVDKARAVGIELSEGDWKDLEAMDAGQTPQAIAARETGTTEGRPYRRRRDDLMRLAEMIRTWPEGDEAQAADGD